MAEEREATDQEIVNFLVSRHNAAIIQSAVDTLNSFQQYDEFKLYLYDEHGTVFKPKGEIKFALVDLF